MAVHIFFPFFLVLPWFWWNRLIWIPFLYEASYQFFWVFVYVNFLKKPKNIQTLFQKIRKTEVKIWGKNLTLFRTGERRLKRPPLTSTNVGITPLNFLNFSFKTFFKLGRMSRPYLLPVRNNSTVTNSTPQKIPSSSQVLIKFKLQ